MHLLTTLMKLKRILGIGAEQSGWSSVILLSFLLFICLGWAAAGYGIPDTQASDDPTLVLELDRPNLVMRSGSNTRLICTLNDQEIDGLVWACSDPDIAQVDDQGMVRAIAQGSALITVVTGDGKARGEAALTVDRQSLPPLATITAARFQADEGIYRDAGASASGKAELMLTGDLMCLKGQQKKARLGESFDFNRCLAQVQPILSQADFVIGNLETMLSETWPYKLDETEIDGKPNCNAPVTFLDALRGAGFDALVTANNHSCDAGSLGISETLAHLDRYQFMHTGLFSASDRPRFIMADINGIRVAFLSYATRFNGKDAGFTTEEAQTMLGVYSEDAVRRDVKAANEQGAQFIIAYIHWGDQNKVRINDRQRTYAQQMANAGVDYIIGSHPHVLQQYDILTAIDGSSVPVMYSMGNFITSMDDVPGNRDAIILRLVLQREGNWVAITDQSYYACYVLDQVDGTSHVVVPISSQYRQGIMSPELHGARERITQSLGNKIREIE